MLIVRLLSREIFAPPRLSHAIIDARSVMMPSSIALIARSVIFRFASATFLGKLWAARLTIRAFSGCASMSGDFHPFASFHRSRRTSVHFCQPGAAGFQLCPVLKFCLIQTTCTWSP